PSNKLLGYCQSLLSELDNLRVASVVSYQQKKRLLPLRVLVTDY
ncbi:MAG: hypothetical protein QOJ02_4127, partial [Acidobacteriota bacterium]|nr:hypothetical protein [Acidobacteriota bacterium]